MRCRRYLLLISIMVIWQVLSYLGIIPKYRVPSPLDVILGVRDLLLVGLPPGYRLPQHIVASLNRVFWGFLFAATIGITLGITMGWSRRLRVMVDPVIEILRPVPPLAWIPISILWFGIGIKSAAFIIFLGAFFPILLSTIGGVVSVDVVLVEASRSLGAKERDVLLKVLVPGAMPSILTGLRIGLGIGWMTLVAAEFTGVKTGYGLGYMIMTARDIQRPDEILAGMAIIGLLGYLMDTVLRVAEGKLLRWR
ncbi:MAG: ABC transporter permease [Pseudomonadota bacterium]